MARKKTVFPANWVQMSDFRWTKNMAKKDRWACKIFIDSLMADIEKRDREIIDISRMFNDLQKSAKKDLIEMRDIKNKQLTDMQEENIEIRRLLAKEKCDNDTLSLITILCAIAVVVMWVICIL